MSASLEFYPHAPSTMNGIVANVPQPKTAINFRVTAPGRVNLIGEHTDYNDGWVLPMAIERGIQFQVSRRNDRVAVIRSVSERAIAAVDLTRPIEPGPKNWTRYVLGVLSGYTRLGWVIPGFEAKISASLPSGGGLSSSAALEIGIAATVEALCQNSLSPLDRALLCQNAEHEFAGVPCGIMDQFAITFGQTDRALLIDCQSQEITPIPLDSREVSVLVIHSGIKHALAECEYAKRRAECGTAAKHLQVDSLRNVSAKRWSELGWLLPALELRRARHVISENKRTLDFAEALKASDWRAAGALMYDSHHSLAKDYEVSCPELDLIVEISRRIPGVFGCRMTGGGFGGCAVALIENRRAMTIMEAFERQYRAARGLTPAMFLTGAAAGPQVLSSE